MMNSLAFRFFIIAGFQFAIFTSTSAFANTIDQDGILKTDNGTVLLLSLHDAMTLCPNGTHPATIRELALDASSRGAQPIVDEPYSNNSGLPAGYGYTLARNYEIQGVSLPQGSGVSYGFYYNPQGYNSSGDLNNKFWSSSCDTTFCQFAYAFDGSKGTIEYGNFNAAGSQFAVRCFKDQSSL